MHYFYDKTIGDWLQLPISWELHSENIQKLMAPIEVPVLAPITSHNMNFPAVFVTIIGGLPSYCISLCHF